MSGAAIVVRDLQKRYGTAAYSVSGVSFSVDEGEIVGLMGPNGAGKSTTLNMLATLIAPSGGDAEILGISIRNKAALRPLIGIALQGTGLDPLMSAKEHFEVHAALYKMSGKDTKKRTTLLLDAFALGDVANRRTGQLSGGTQRRVSLALALMHDPKVIIFDEPTVGLDPNLRKSVWQLLMDLRSQGLTVLFSTHYADEAEKLCQRVLLMAQGRVVASGTPDILKARVTDGFFRLKVSGPMGRSKQLFTQAQDGGLIPCAAEYRPEENAFYIKARPHDLAMDALLALMQEQGISITDLHWGQGSLDDVFNALAKPVRGEGQAQPVAMQHGALARRAVR